MRKKNIIIINVFSLLVIFGIIITVTLRRISDGSIESSIEISEEQDVPLLETQETAEHENITEDAFDLQDIYLFGSVVRWFRSNAGGMALEEVPSRYAALRNEYALEINFLDHSELPEILRPYFRENYYIETRKLYENGAEIRTQWIFADNNHIIRLIASFAKQNDNEEENFERGFIELYNDDAILITEINYFDKGSRNRIDYTYREGQKIRSDYFIWTEDGDYKPSHTDRYFYNRSMFLRSVERVFHADMQINDESLSVNFPLYIFHAALNDTFINERLNPLPEFLSDINVYENDRIVSVTDERGRVLTQTLYDSEDNIIWTIQNTWQDDRIILVRKTEGDDEFLAEYEYDADGSRTLERNIRNGVLERIVRTEGNIDIEELIFNNVVVLQAIWEDGVKISETRVVP